jgi:superfamily II DNA or RNA helicase
MVHMSDRKILRDYQQEAFDTFKTELALGKGKLKGRFVYPTGSGKTCIEASCLNHQITKGKDPGIHVVAGPRIVLMNQLLREIRADVTVPFRALAFHSGKHEIDYARDGIQWKEESTTSPSVVLDHIEKATHTGHAIVIFTTYHSMHLLKGIHFDTLIADESQYLVSQTFGSSIREMKADVQLFFTATEKHTASGSGRGLNNEKVFGKVLGKVAPAVLIERGYIVPPKLHIMHGTTLDEDKSVIDEVIQLAKAQHRITTDMGMISSKILFATRGSGDIELVEKKLKQINQALPDHTVFSITAKNGSKIDGKSVTREYFLKQLRNATNALIIHYDILSEGIDVDGITGVVLLRDMSQAKLLQTIGRAVRPYKLAPKLKPFALVSVSALNGDEDMKERVLNFVRALRDNGFDLSKEDIYETKDPRHIPDDEDPDFEDAGDRKILGKGLLSIENIVHELEQDDLFDAALTANSVEDALEILLED